MTTRMLAVVTPAIISISVIHPHFHPCHWHQFSAESFPILTGASRQKKLPSGWGLQGKLNHHGTVSIHRNQGSSNQLDCPFPLRQEPDERSLNQVLEPFLDRVRIQIDLLFRDALGCRAVAVIVGGIHKSGPTTKFPQTTILAAMFARTAVGRPTSNSKSERSRDF